MPREKRDIHGVLLLNKPKGMSSNNILQRMKHLFKGKKAGHTGALDPLATGMLPICFGEATKFSQYLLDADKTYTVTAKLGLRTDTSDAEGEIVAEKTVGDYSLNEIETALDSFRGEISQTPSIYSALKYQGKPLYYYARQGIDVPRPTRQITIFNLTLVDYQKPFLKLKVHCSKGTYIRTIVDDLGELLGCGAHVTELHRDTVGNFRTENMVTVDTLENDEQRDAYLLPLESLISDFKQIQLTEEYVQRIRFGQKLNLKTCFKDYVVEQNPLVALMDHDNKLIGMGEVDEYAILSVKRLLSFQAD